MHLLVGLGNPGSQYEGTRHNVGFMALDRLVVRHGLGAGQEKFQSLLYRGRIGGIAVILAKPRTYMNLSGEAVGRIVDYYGVPVAKILVLHDDMDIEVGRLKVAARGGAGGHKGVSSIIQRLGEDAFARIKIGVGRPPAGWTAENWVLGRFTDEETKTVESVLDSAGAAAELFISDGAAEAQTRYNRKT